MMTNSLPIKLTVGWPPIRPDSMSAKELHSHASSYSGENNSYEDILLEQLDNKNISQIAGLDRLLRRRKDGFADINRFTGSILKVFKSVEHIRYCEIDIFAFTFLKYAKNYDLFMEPSLADHQKLQQIVSEWQEKVQALEDFERLGKGVESGSTLLTDTYLQLREAVSRPSARDEQRTLAILLCSGPSSLEDISIDLGLNYSLNERVMAVLQKTGVIECREQETKPLYRIKEDAIPVVLLLVREIIGLDFMAMVAGLLEEL